LKAAKIVLLDDKHLGKNPGIKQLLEKFNFDQVWWYYLEGEVKILLCYTIH